tara:strand:- start:228 stop:467 length:240 start_codon:yes stop_codon:yes gene_type:complete
MTTYTTDQAFDALKNRIEEMRDWDPHNAIIDELTDNPLIATLEAARAAFDDGDKLDHYVDELIEPHIDQEIAPSWNVEL